MLPQDSGTGTGGDRAQPWESWSHWAGGWEPAVWLKSGETAVSRLSLLSAVLLPGGRHWGQDTWWGCGSHCCSQALFSPCPVGERGISLMHNKASCPSLFPGMHFSLNNEVTNIEYLLNVLWWWLRGTAWLHEQVQRFCSAGTLRFTGSVVSE